MDLASIPRICSALLEAEARLVAHLCGRRSGIGQSPKHLQFGQDGLVDVPAKRR
jgi:hypothetical protein